MDSSTDAPQHGDGACDHVTRLPEKRKRGRPQKSTDNMDSSTDAPQHGDAACDHVTRPPEKRKRGRPKKTLACTKSGYSSHLRDSFKRHERPFKCDRCNYAAIQKVNLVRHMENHTSKSPLKCKHCGYRASTQSALSRHKAVHLEKKATNSDNVLASGSQKEEDITMHSTCRLFCNENEPVPSTQYQTALTNHLTVHSKKKAEKSCSATDTPSTVAECVEPNASKQALFRGKSELETVQDKHGKKRKKQLKTRTEKKVDCSIVANVKPEASQDGTNDKKSLRLQCDGVARPGQNHKQTTCHKRFACKGCAFTTPVKGTLKRHMFTHSSQKPYKCRQCDYTAIRKVQLLLHMKGHTRNSLLKCGKCGFGTNFKFVLSRHMAIHTKKEPGNSTTSTSQKDETVTGHAQDQIMGDQSEPETNSKPQTPSRKMQTKKKVSKPSGVTNVKPEVSEKGTESHQLLRDCVSTTQKIKPATPNKPFMCKVCGYATAIKGDLKRHMFRHSSQKPYKCDRCDYSATQKHQLLQHLKGHTCNGLLKCKYCGFSSDHQGVITKHEEVHLRKESDKSGNSTTSRSQEEETVTAHARDQLLSDQSESETSNKAGTPSSKTHTKKKAYKPNNITNVKPEVSFDNTDNKEHNHLLQNRVSMTQNNKPLVCKACGFWTARKHDLKRHMLLHSSDNPFKCDRCGYAAVQKHQLHVHMKGHTRNSPLKCLECGYGTNCQKFLTRHKAVHTKKEADKSGNATTSTSQEEPDTGYAQDQLLSDQSETKTNNEAQTPSKNTHTKKKVYKPNNVTAVKIDLSQDSTDNKERNKLLHGHVSTTQNNKQLVCKECGFCTARKSQFRVHVRIHSGEKPYKCDLCGYSAAQRNGLNCHMKGHTHKRPLKCSECGFSTSRQKFLTSHMAVHVKKQPDKSDNVTTSTSQEEPDTAYAQNQLLMSGQSETETYNEAPTPSKNTHTEKKVYKPNNVTAVKIDLSQDSTDNKERNKLLHSHVSTTQNNKQLVCKECGFCTTRKSQFRVHVRIHSGEKPYKCDLCGYSAAQQNGLNCHMKGHTHKRPLKCSECGFSTSRQKFLTSHMAVHVKKQPDESDNVTTSTSEEVVHDIILADNQTTQNIKSDYKTGKKDVSPKGGRKSSNVTTGKPEQNQHTVPNSETQPLLNIKYRYELRDKVAVVKEEIHTGEQPRKRRRGTSNAEKEKRQCVEPSASKTFLCRQCQEIHTAEKPCKPHVGRPSAEEEEKPASRKIKISASNLSKPFQCGQCAYLTNNVWKFDHHLVQHSCKDLSKNRYLCGQCAFATSKKSHWDRHTLQHCETKPFACDKCNFRTNYRFYLSAHAQRMHLSQKTKAYKQVIKFSHQKSDPKSYEHMYTVGCGARAKRMYSCKKCEYAAAMKVLILRHVKTHTKDKQQNGNNNNSSYSQPENEKQVSESKSSTRSMTLTEVTKFSRPKSEPKSEPKSNPKSYEHMYTVGSTNLASNLYSCRKCEYAAALKAPMLRHVKTHTEDKPQDWNDSNSSKSRHDDEKHFSDSKASTRSMTLTEVTKFSRPTSEPKSSPKSYEHMYTLGSTNLASNLYSCKKCEYASALKAPMLRHVKTHTEEKPQDWNDGNSSTS